MSKIVYAHIYKQRLLYEARIEIKKKRCVTTTAFSKILKATGQTSLLFDDGTLAMDFAELNAIGYFSQHGRDPFFETY